MPNTHETLTSLFSDIADAIRFKSGEKNTIIADNFPEAILALPEPIEINIKPLEIVANGTYTAGESGTENVDGWNPLTVNVPNTYTSSDETKVVSNAQLIAQTKRDERSTPITENGNKTYDVTYNKELKIKVAVPKIPEFFQSTAGDLNNHSTKNKISFTLTNWKGGNELCMLLTNSTTIATCNPIYGDNSVIGSGANQGGWYTSAITDNITNRTEHIVITGKARTDIPGRFDWLICTVCGSSAIYSYAFYQPNVVLGTDDTTINTIEFTSSGLKINGVTLAASNYYAAYSNNAWSAIQAGGNVADFASYFVNLSYIYFGIATPPTSTNTAYCMRKVSFD